MNKKNKLSKEVLKNAQDLGLIQITDYTFKLSIKDDFTVDLSASGNSQLAILRNCLEQLLVDRNNCLSNYNSLIGKSLSSKARTLDSLEEMNLINQGLLSLSKKSTDYLIQCAKNKSIPTSEKINDILDS